MNHAGTSARTLLSDTYRSLSLSWNSSENFDRAVKLDVKLGALLVEPYFSHKQAFVCFSFQFGRLKTGYWLWLLIPVLMILVKIIWIGGRYLYLCPLTCMAPCLTFRPVHGILSSPWATLRIFQSHTSVALVETTSPTNYCCVHSCSQFNFTFIAPAFALCLFRHVCFFWISQLEWPLFETMSLTWTAIFTPDLHDDMYTDFLSESPFWG